MRLWEQLIGSSAYNDEEEERLSRLLNGILLIILILGFVSAIGYGIEQDSDSPPDLLSPAALILLFGAYILNRRGKFKTAVPLMLSTMILALFGTFWLGRNQDFSANILFYLIVPILLGEFFLSVGRYITITILTLASVLVFLPLNPGILNIFFFLVIFASLVGLAGHYRQKLERARQDRLLSIERHHTQQMELLNSITHAALETVDLQEVVQTLANRMGDLLEADGAYLTLWDEALQKTIPAAASGKYRQVYPGIRFKPGEKTLTESVLEVGRPLVIEDTFNTPFMSPSVAAQFPTRSILALPLIANSRRLGAALIGFNETHYFTESEIKIGERAAAQIALAVYKAHLLNVSLRQVDQLELLSEVGRQIAKSLDEQEILERTLEAVVNKFGYAEAAISLLVDGDTLEVTAINGTEDFGYRPGYQQKTGQGIIGRVAQIRESYVTGDVAKDPYYFSTTERNGSAMGVPMQDKEHLLGVLYVESTIQDAFKSDDVQTLQTLASQVATSLQKARLYARTQEHLQVMTTLQSVSHVVTSSLELKEILHNVIGLLKESFGYTYISIYLLDGEVLHLGAEIGYPADLIIQQIPITSGVVGRAARTKQVQFIHDVGTDPMFLRASYEVKSEICVPLLKNENVLGVLNVESKSEVPLDENDVNLLTALAGPVAVAVDNARLHAEVKRMALTDVLSGLANRRAFDEFLQIEITRAKRYADPLSLIIMDLDSFKEYNDKWGHPAGDVRLREIADLLRAKVREPDLAARYGGEEFAVILPNTSKEGAIVLAERLRIFAEELAPVKHDDGSPKAGYTISLGVATFPEDADTLDELLIAADNAELCAKQLGKNRVCAAGNSNRP